VLRKQSEVRGIGCHRRKPVSSPHPSHGNIPGRRTIGGKRDLVVIETPGREKWGRVSLKGITLRGKVCRSQVEQIRVNPRTSGATKKKNIQRGTRLSRGPGSASRKKTCRLRRTRLAQVQAGHNRRPGGERCGVGVNGGGMG